MSDSAPYFRTNDHTPLNCDELYADREIITREPTVLIHGPSGKTIAAGPAIAKVLLAPRRDHNDDPSGDVAYECSTCGLIFVSANAVSAHRITHGKNNSREQNNPHTRYSADTVRQLVRLMRIAERSGIGNTATRVSDQLNESGVMTLDGTPWTANRVSAAYSRWKSQVRVRISARDTAMSTDTTVESSSDSNDIGNVDDTNDVNDAGDADTTADILSVARSMTLSFKEMTDAMQLLHDAVLRVGPTFDRVAQAIERGTATNADTAAKAKRYDELQRLLRD